ncbi:MAG: DUF1707 SHOCT-like domain-containing protein [Micromonosporaceae bacterium]
MHSKLRVGDSDRDRTVAVLGEHAAAGRLSLAEFDARAQAAYAAQTVGELALLTADLPAMQPATPVRRPLLVSPAMVYPVAVFVLALVVLTVLAVAAGQAVADGMTPMSAMMGGMAGGGCR